MRILGWTGLLLGLSLFSPQASELKGDCRHNHCDHHHGDYHHYDHHHCDHYHCHGGWYGGVFIDVPVTPGPRVVVVEREPPPEPQEVIYACPGPEFIWVKGYWTWQGYWVWTPGHWEQRPHPEAVWISGSWERRPGGWVWIGGRWR